MLAVRVQLLSNQLQAEAQSGSNLLLGAADVGGHFCQPLDDGASLPGTRQVSSSALGTVWGSIFDKGCGEVREDPGVGNKDRQII